MTVDRRDARVGRVIRDKDSKGEHGWGDEREGRGRGKKEEEREGDQQDGSKSREREEEDEKVKQSINQSINQGRWRKPMGKGGGWKANSPMDFIKYMI